MNRSADNVPPADFGGENGSSARADERASAWFDAAPPDARGAIPDPFARLDAGGQRRLADLQFLHVLLDELHNPSIALTSARVCRAMTAIHAESAHAGVNEWATSRAAERDELVVPARGSRSTARAKRAPSIRVSRRRWLVSALATAAAGSGVAAWLVSSSASTSAYDAVVRSADNARQLQDRRYLCVFDLNHARGVRRETKSCLFVRGGEKYAMQIPSLFGNVWVGSNGREGWLVPVIGDPIITRNPSYPAQWAGDAGVALPDFTLSGLLYLMAERFRLTILPDEPLPAKSGVPCQRISGICQAGDGGPNGIELWANRLTGVAERLVLTWSRQASEEGVVRIQLDLLNQNPQGDEMYEVSGHRHPRPVLPRIPLLPSGSSK